VNLYRKAFARHYCPTCGARARRIREPFVEWLLREALLFVPLAFGVVVLGGLVAKLGAASGYEALAVGCVLAGLAAYPVVEQYSQFRCSSCGKVSAFGEVVSRGWSLV
jgi:predicted RNA-binding Zn-ribbon protein involved in translation (DUF1610 family)